MKRSETMDIFAFMHHFDLNSSKIENLLAQKLAFIHIDGKILKTIFYICIFIIARISSNLGLSHPIFIFAFPVRFFMC